MRFTLKEKVEVGADEHCHCLLNRPAETMIEAISASMVLMWMKNISMSILQRPVFLSVYHSWTMKGAIYFKHLNENILKHEQLGKQHVSHFVDLRKLRRMYVIVICVGAKGLSLFPKLSLAPWVVLKFHRLTQFCSALIKYWKPFLPEYLELLFFRLKPYRQLRC